MKISVNLATLTSARERYALAWAVPLALFSAAGFVLLTIVAIQSVREYHKIQDNLSDLLKQEQQLRDHEISLQKDLEQPQERAVFKKAHFVNGLIERKELTITALTEKVSKLMPPNVRLSSMSLSQSKTDLMVRFTVVGESLDGLESFLGRLEDSPDFNEFAVSSQGFQPARTVGGLVGINCSVRYVGDGAN